MFDFEYQLKVLPDKPGVYLMKNNLGEIIYVGKAKILKNRVRQYFQSSKGKSEKVKAMVSNIAEFEYIVTDSEMESLILECNLIKKYTPRYNILLKDDKHYPFIKITTNEDFPRIFVTRLMIKDGNKYFGPYTDVSAVNDTIELIKKIFPIRSCKLNLKEGQKILRPCLNYQIGLCGAPCSSNISKEAYSTMIKDVIDLLAGRENKTMVKLNEDMTKASEELEFEKAANIRDKIIAIKKITEKQKIFSGNFEDEDYINVAKDEKDSSIQVFFLRDGKITGREHFILEDTANEERGIIISDFIKQFYGGTAFLPKTIYVPETQDMELLADWLSIKKGNKLQIKIPQKGEKKELMDMVYKNAKIMLEQFKLKFIKDKEKNNEALKELSELINLEEIPDRIEAFDISNILGVDSVGSMVVFEAGRPKSSDYRRFKIKNVKGANDYDSMREILQRRFQHGLDEVKSIRDNEIKLSAGKFSSFPDLILMDGGKGQVNIALEVLQDFNIDIPVCGMVKDDKHNTRGLIYNNNEVQIKGHNEVNNLITRIQDEVHRFAISYHRSLRDKRVLHSILEDIPNVGNRRRKELLKKFGSIENIKTASYEDILSTEGIDKRAAESVVNYFSKERKI
jgi:excinuclease ABC subunit C